MAVTVTVTVHPVTIRPDYIKECIKDYIKESSDLNVTNKVTLHKQRLTIMLFWKQIKHTMHLNGSLGHSEQQLSFERMKLHKTTISLFKSKHGSGKANTVDWLL